MSFLRVYLPFAAGYLLSYVFRTVNAVISPELVRELALSPAALGLLTSAYFIAFGAMQIPAGMLLDRYGPRRVEPVLLLIAALGALGFALAGGELGLLVARGFIGVGVATCLMAPLKGIATWYPRNRHASLAGWVMVAGGCGALLATAPLELALRFLHWRAVFVILAVATVAVAAWMAWRVPDIPKAERTLSFREQWAGVRLVFAAPRFWWIAPLGALGMGTFMAIQGLWSVPWMMEVQGMDRAAAARHLLAMSVVTLGGYLVLGAFSMRLAARGISARHLFGAGFALNALCLAAIIANLPGSYAWWSLYGLGASVNVLGFTVLSEGFPRELTARANTGLNLLMFSGSFVCQWGIGLIVDFCHDELALATAAAFRVAFAAILAVETLTYAWFLAGWRRYGRESAPLAAQAT